MRKSSTEISSRHALVREQLDALRQRYDTRYLSTDPLKFPRRFATRNDREIVGLVASALAYGTVKMICQNLERLFVWMGPEPATFVRKLDPQDARRSLGTFQHRWSRPRDVVCLLWFIRQMIETAGSVGEFFEETYVPNDIATSLELFSRRALDLDQGGLYRGRDLPTRAGVRFFFTNPRTGACKRMNMYLRWMVRPNDGLDFGLWRFMSPRELVIPLDTHIYRIGRHLGWTSRKTATWPAAIEITQCLAMIDPEDPVKYDFALSRIGIWGNCPNHGGNVLCDICTLKQKLHTTRFA